MRRDGILFTLAAVMVGVIVFAFSVAYNETAKTYVADKRIIELERATGQCANAEYNVQKTFKRYAGYNISQEKASLSVTGFLPYNNTRFQVEMNRIKNFTDGHLANTTVDLPGPVPKAFASNGVNLTYEGDDTLIILLPEIADNITFNAYIDRPVYSNAPGNCSIPPNDPLADNYLDFNVTGNNGDECDRANIRLNLSNSTFIGVNWRTVSYNITFEVSGRVINISNTYDTPLSYNLTVWTNESRYVLPARADASVGSNIGSAGCGRGVRLA